MAVSAVLLIIMGILVTMFFSVMVDSFIYKVNIRHLIYSFILFFFWKGGGGGGGGGGGRAICVFITDRFRYSDWNWMYAIATESLSPVWLCSTRLGSSDVCQPLLITRLSPVFLTLINAGLCVCVCVCLCVSTGLMVAFNDSIFISRAVRLSRCWGRWGMRGCRIVPSLCGWMDQVFQFVRAKGLVWNGSLSFSSWFDARTLIIHELCTCQDA